MDPFSRLEALIETGGADAVDQARTLLSSVAGSKLDPHAVDEFLIEMMTLAFLAEGGLASLQTAARRMARLRLSRLKIFVG